MQNVWSRDEADIQSGFLVAVKSFQPLDTIVRLSDLKTSFKSGSVGQTYA